MPRYTPTKATRTSRKLLGGIMNWKSEPSGVNGMAIANATTPRVVRSNGLLGLLL